MKINNLNSLNTIRNIGGLKDIYQAEHNKESTAPDSEKIKKPDVFSSGIYSPGSEMEPRVELLKEVIRKINSGNYDSQDVFIKVSEKVLEKVILPEMQQSQLQSSDINQNEIRNKIDNDFYSDSKIMKKTAGKLIDTLLPGLLK